MGTGRRTGVLWVLALTLARCLVAGSALSPRPTPELVSIVPLPANPTPAANQALARYEMGLVRQRAGETEGALQAFSEALTLDPALAPAYVARGALFLGTGQPEAALADAQGAVAADPVSAIAHALLGEVLRRGFADPLQALEAYRRAVELDSDLAPALFPARWEAAVNSGQADRMLALSREYRAAHPDSPLAAYYRARALLALGVPRAAIRTLVGAMSQGGPAALWFVLGEAYRAEEAWPQARTCFEQAQTLVEAGDLSLSQVSLTPQADLLVALGTAYLYTGTCQDAERLLEQALSLGIDGPGVQTLIGQALICQLPAPTPTTAAVQG